jgi:hypothetical protein
MPQAHTCIIKLIIISKFIDRPCDYRQKFLLHKERGILILDVVPLLYIQYTTVK